MRRRPTSGPAAATAVATLVSGTLLALLPATGAQAAVSTLTIPGVCSGSYEFQRTANGATATIRAYRGCQGYVQLSCETYTGAAVSGVDGPVAYEAARVSLRGQPQPADLTDCSAYFRLIDPATGDFQYADYSE